MPQELLLQVSPEIAADASLLQQYLSKQIKVGNNEIQHVVIVKRCLDFIIPDFWELCSYIISHIRGLKELAPVKNISRSVAL